MSSVDIFYQIGHFLEWTLSVYDVIGNSFNLILLISGFSGFLYWMFLQYSFNKKASTDPTQIK
ncbi:MAG: hypothetical protein P8I93_04470 [Crocinitomicaceae bacterium]|nr:hypothetical protein [Crocinitomicaceae bacterium]